MKLSDYAAKFLSDCGIKYVFGLTGGANVHLFDSLDHTPGITSIFTHHEQAAALAAEAYGRITNNLGAAIVTTGPGGTNAITGVTAAWLDSLPCIFISGQTRFQHTSRGKSVRQIGSQELDIVSIVSPITKYAIMLDDPNKIKFYLQKAVYLARTGRPGPVWIDIPLDFQWANIEPDKLPSFDPKKEKVEKISEKKLDELVLKCWNLLNDSKKPLILAGYGIRLAHAEKEFKECIKFIKIPYVSSWNTSDLLPTKNNLYVGRVGLAGQRGGNTSVAECDLLLAIGSHLCLTITGLDFESFAKNSKKVIVDIDPVELNFQALKSDLNIQCDAKIFLQKLNGLAKRRKYTPNALWRTKCLQYKTLNTIPPSLNTPNKYVDAYTFVDTLSDELNSDDVIVVDGGGTVVYVSYQAFKLKKNQRLILSSGLCAMGTGLPESIGACFANRRRRTICMIGDGSMQLNIQELQTIVHHHLPIKIFVINNDGYLAIRHTQTTFLNSKYVGSSKKGGVSLPDYQKIASAYGLRFIHIHSQNNFVKKVRSALKGNDPVLCEVMVPPDQQLLPVK